MDMTPNYAIKKKIKNEIHSHTQQSHTHTHTHGMYRKLCTCV